VIACLIIMLCVGLVYMWSVFQQPVIDHYGWPVSAVTMVSSVMILMFAAGIFIGGTIVDRFGPKIVIMTAGILFFTGLILTSLLTPKTPFLIYITYGVLAGVGVGFAYSGAINCVQKWLPHRRGFAAGICVCAFGLSIVIFSPITERLLEIGVPFAFRILALLLGPIVFASSFFVLNPPEGYAESLGVKKLDESDVYSLGEAIRDPRFWFMVSALYFLPATYMIVLPIVKTLASLRGISGSQASITVQLIGVASAVSRLVLPTISDKLGRSKSIFAMTILMVISSLLMIFADGILYSVVIFLIVFAYSGPSGIYPAMSADAFGMKNTGAIFGLSFISLGLSSLTFNWVADKLNADAAVTGNYTKSFIVGAIVCIIPMVCMLIYNKTDAKLRAKRLAKKEDLN
jgi:OFA family oxalate/formate antiporter-like MFS transporter